MSANVHKTKYSDFTPVMALFQPLVGSLFFLTIMFSWEMILSLFVAGAEGVEVRFSWPAQGLVRLRGVTQVTFRGRQSFVRVRRVDTDRFVAGAGMACLPIPFHENRGRRHLGEALTIRAPATRPCPRRRPSVVTEGYL